MSRIPLVAFSVIILFGSLSWAKVDPNTNTESRLSSDVKLSKAIEALDPNAVKAALDSGANPNLTFYNGNLSALARAIIETKSFDSSMKKEKKEEICLTILNALFDAGAKIQHYDKSILFYAIADGFPKVVELLIDKGANPTAKLEGMTPIEWAESYDHQAVVDVLKEYGGEPSSKEQAAQNRFVHWACYSFERTALFEQKNIIEMEKALEEGASVNGKNSKGEIALVAAIGPSYNVEEYITVAYLLQKGANPNLKSAKDYTGLDGIALHHSVGFHGLMLEAGEDRTIYQKLIIEALLNAGAHISSRGHNGMTPLHIAAKQNDIYMATALIKAGAKIMPKDDTGKTPLDYAESSEMIKLLKSHGAKEL